MPEMPPPREHHREAVLVGGGDHLVVADAAAGHPVSVVSETGLVTPFFSSEAPRDFAGAAAWRKLKPRPRTNSIL